MESDSINLITHSVSVLETANLLFSLYILSLTIISSIFATKKLVYLWKYRHIRKVWGIKNNDVIVLVCSELDNPDIRQKVEEKEFYYIFKYGDVDAYFEVFVTLLRLFPKIKLKVMTSGEVLKTRIDIAQNLILIGGPDYNAIAEHFLNKKITRFNYKCSYRDDKPTETNNEIVVFDSVKNKEYCEESGFKDYGYFEKIKNPYNPQRNIIFLGGCHTIGVTGTVKAFSMAESEQGEIPKQVYQNAKLVSKHIKKNSEFSILFKVDRVGQTLNVPLVNESYIY